MNKLVLKGRCRQSGQLITVEKLTSFTLEAGLDSPASTLTATASWKGLPPQLSHLSLTLGGKTLFSGAVDELTTTIGAKGTTLQLEARSKGGALLDNEAPPGTLYSVNTPTAFSLLVGKLGFVATSFPLGRLAQFIIHKGKSRWQALCDFSKAITGLPPYCIGDTVFFTPPRGEKHWVLSNQQKVEGESFTQLQHVSSPYKVLSKVYLQNREGYYSSSLSNPFSQNYPVQRERYLIPPKDIGAPSQTGAYELLSASVQGAESYLVDLPRLIHPSLGDTGSLALESLQLHNLMLVGFRLKLNPQGSTTRLHFQHPLL